mgnify:CR=1 FL=1|tara:strand:+ start:499 stop:702 length:204 start_codon:yes stop_codon:yes gene_type:complete
MITISVEFINWLLIGGASLCAFMIGKILGEKNHEDTIKTTIDYFIDEGFIRWKKTNGEIELLKLDDD